MSFKSDFGPDIGPDLGPDYIGVAGGNIPSFSISPISVIKNSVSNVLSLSGTNTAWTTGTTFSSILGAITSTSVNALSQIATLHYNAGSVVGTDTISDSTDTATSTISIISNVIVLISTDGGSTFTKYGGLS